MRRTFSGRDTRHAALACLTALALAAVAPAHTARAQEEGFDSDFQDSDTDSQDSGSDTSGGGSTLLSDEQALQEERAPQEEFRQDTNPYEEPGKPYLFGGLMYRHIFMPAWVLELFVGKAPLVDAPGGGAEFTYRVDGFDVVGSLWWQSYNFVGPFQDNEKEETATEIIDSDLDLVVGTASFLWSTSFNDMWAVEYGLDVGLALIFGTLNRTEAYQNLVGEYVPCQVANNGGPLFVPDDQGRPVPPTTDQQNYATACGTNPSGGTAADGENGEHYNVNARKWTDGGSVPNVLPWIGPRLGVRFKPIHQLMMRIDAGFGLGSYVGASASFGF